VASAGLYASLHPMQTTTPTSHHSVFTGRMPFLTPNQQRQSTEGTSTEGITIKNSNKEKVVVVALASLNSHSDSGSYIHQLTCYATGSDTYFCFLILAYRSRKSFCFSHRKKMSAVEQSPKSRNDGNNTARHESSSTGLCAYSTGNLRPPNATGNCKQQNSS